MFYINCRRRQEIVYLIIPASMDVHSISSVKLLLFLELYHCFLVLKVGNIDSCISENIRNIAFAIL